MVEFEMFNFKVSSKFFQSLFGPLKSDETTVLGILYRIWSSCSIAFIGTFRFAQAYASAHCFKLISALPWNYFSPAKYAKDQVSNIWNRTIRNWPKSKRSRNVCSSLISQFAASLTLFVLGMFAIICTDAPSYHNLFFRSHSISKYDIASALTTVHFSTKFLWNVSLFLFSWSLSIGKQFESLLFVMYECRHFPVSKSSLNIQNRYRFVV